MSTFTTGRINSTSGSRYMYAYCSQTTNGSSANTSTINWTIYTKEGGSTCYDTGPTYLWIGGVQRYYKARTSWSSFAFPAAAGSTSGSYTLTHNNDGSVAAQEVSLKSAIYTGEWNSTTVSGTWTLDKIARYFSSTPSVSLASRTETSITLNWSTSETCSSISWSGGGSNVSTTGVPGTSGTVTFTGLTANTTYNIYGTFKRSDSGLTSNSSSTGFTTYNYPHITAVGTANLTIGGAQTVTLYNPMGRSVTVKMYQVNNGTALCTSSATTGTSVSFTPNATTLYNTIKSAQSSSCYYSAVCSSPSKTMNTSSNYTYKITGNETPTFAASSIATYDATTAVTNITGQTANGGWLVQGLSKLKIALTTAGSAKNGASISKYEVTFAGTTKTLSINTTGDTWNEFNGTGAQTISVKVTDSRGLTTTVTKNVTYVAYKAPSISLSGGRKNNYGTDVDLSVSYTGSDVQGKNGVKVSWSGASKSGYFAGSASAYDTAETNTKTAAVAGVDNNAAFTFTATIVDKFGKTTTSKVSVPVGRAAMFVDVEQAGVGINCLPSGQGLYVDSNLQVGGKRLLQRFPMDLSDYDSGTFYPVIFDTTIDRIDCEIVSPSSGDAATWNQNAISFSMKQTGWSDTPKSLFVSHYGCHSNSEITIGCIAGGDRGGNACVWLRGGMDYRFFSNTKPTLYVNGFTSSSEEVYSIGSGYSGGTNTNITIHFTPQTTLSAGAYFSRGVRVSGTLKAGTVECEGNVSGSTVKSTNNITAGKDLVANSGWIYSYSNGKYVRIGNENAGFAHYTTDATNGHWFNKTLYAAGAMYKGSGYNQNVPAVFVQTTQPTATQIGDIWVI